MEDLIKGELDWHNKVNENFHEVDSQMAENTQQINDIICDLRKYENLKNDNDWTSALQKAIDDGYPNIYIPFPIQISTVTIPPNRPIKIWTNWYINIYGTPLITILQGGEGIKFEGSKGTLSTGVILDSLSFTSLSESVISAIHGTSLSGFSFKNLYFGQIKGSAFILDGQSQDGDLDFIHCVDCGDTDKSVAQYGDDSHDSNRLSTRNLRIERSSGLMLDIRGNAYAIDFTDIKLHGSSASTGLLKLSTQSSGIRFSGGQISLNSSGDTVTIDGNSNILDGLFISNGLGLGVDISNAIKNIGIGTKIINNVFSNMVDYVLTSSGESATIKNNTFLSCGRVKITGAFTNYLNNQHINSDVGDGTNPDPYRILDFNGSYGNCADNVFKNNTNTITAAIQNGGIGNSFRGNKAYDSHFYHTISDVGTLSAFSHNFGKAILGSVINKNTATNANNVYDTTNIGIA